MPDNLNQHPELDLRFEANSKRLSDLAKKRQRERRISFGEALSQVAAEHPALTAPDSVVVLEDDLDARPAGADPNLWELVQLAKKLQFSDNVTFGEALSQVAAENPRLTVPVR